MADTVVLRSSLVDDIRSAFATTDEGVAERPRWVRRTGPGLPARQKSMKPGSDTEVELVVTVTLAASLATYLPEDTVGPRDVRSGDKVYLFAQIAGG